MDKVLRESEVLALRQHLPEVEEGWLSGVAEGMAWQDWNMNCHFADSIRVGQTIGDWQVYRYFDVEGEKLWDVVNVDKPEEWPDWVDAGMVQEAEVRFEEVDDDGNEIMCANIFHDDMQLYGEYVQMWVNVKDGQVIMLGKPYAPDETYFDEQAEWVVIDEERHSKYHWNGHCVGHQTRHFDQSVHPELFAKGYDPIELDYYEDLMYANDRSVSTYYDMCGCIADYASHLVKGDAYDWLVREFGITRPEFCNPERKNIYRIARKHHYQLQDVELYNAYIEELVFQHKDTHNPHYICPADLRAAYDRLHERHARIVAQQAREAEAKCLYEDAHAEEIFAKLRAPYLDIEFGNSQYHVHVLQSVREYVEEGVKMHHCVGRMGYWKKTSSICVSIRLKDEEQTRYATAEISLEDYSVLQCYGVCDRVVDDDRDVRQLLLDNAWRFKQATEGNYKQAI